MTLLFSLIYLALALVQYLLVLRIVLDVVQSFARSWRPQGLVLVIASAVYTLTDPALRWLRSKIPPVNVGGIGLDVAFLVLFLAVVILKSVARGLAI
ncbi:YggT family protein [Micrococcus terreus]|uniref:YggT family protein n=1 Tax=Micrococcus terreus TaxID=574650 RepID=A0A1I7MKR8_9MICC|nr:YggT family protein [Micrococcus terreus]MDK7702232.1 YggT family protein [Micrococcus terreus]WOO98506.1 YggT family protein [Micrococcus terreus]SFV22518.1 YggT family protein [Micrococcus terreus]